MSLADEFTRALVRAAAYAMLFAAGVVIFFWGAGVGYDQADREWREFYDSETASCQPQAT